MVRFGPLLFSQTSVDNHHSVLTFSLDVLAIPPHPCRYLHFCAFSLSKYPPNRLPPTHVNVMPVQSEAVSILQSNTMALPSIHNADCSHKTAYCVFVYSSLAGISCLLPSGKFVSFRSGWHHHKGTLLVPCSKSCAGVFTVRSLRFYSIMSGPAVTLPTCNGGALFCENFPSLSRHAITRRVRRAFKQAFRQQQSSSLPLKTASARNHHDHRVKPVGPFSLSLRTILMMNTLQNFLYTTSGDGFAYMVLP
jgi:hypothetical protein